MGSPTNPAWQTTAVIRKRLETVEGSLESAVPGCDSVGAGVRRDVPVAITGCDASSGSTVNTTTTFSSSGSGSGDSISSGGGNVITNNSKNSSSDHSNTNITCSTNDNVDESTYTRNGSLSDSDCLTVATISHSVVNDT